MQENIKKDKMLEAKEHYLKEIRFRRGNWPTKKPKWQLIENKLNTKRAKLLKDIEQIQKKENETQKITREP